MTWIFKEGFRGIEYITEGVSKSLLRAWSTQKESEWQTT